MSSKQGPTTPFFHDASGKTPTMGRRRKVPPHKTAAAALARASRHPSSSSHPSSYQASSEPATADPDLSDAEDVPREQGKSPQSGNLIPDFPESELSDLESVSDGENECSWDGGVNHIISDSDGDWESTGDGEGIGSDSDLSELEGPELVESLHSQLEREIAAFARATPYEKINQPMSAKDWKKVEANRALGYTGHSERTKRRRGKEERDVAERKAASMKS